MIYLYDTKKYPMQLVLCDIVMRTEMARLSFVQDQYGRNDLTEQTAVAIQGIKYGLIAVTMLPMLILYPFIQRYFAKGVMIGRRRVKRGVKVLLLIMIGLILSILVLIVLLRRDRGAAPHNRHHTVSVKTTAFYRGRSVRRADRAGAP